MKKHHSEAFKRIIVLILAALGLLMETGVYAVCWFISYYPLVSLPRINDDGYLLSNGLKLYFRGHLLVIAIYFILLLFLTATYGGLKIGYLKAMDIFFSQIFSLFLVNFISYFQISLMRNWIVPVGPILVVFVIQLILSFLWAVVCNRIYHLISLPRRLLLVSGDYPVDDIKRKFDSRQDRFEIACSMNIRDGLEAVEEACEMFDGVVIWDIPASERNRLLKYCYGRSIRVYLMPKISDVLIKGSTEMHLFDTPVMLLREYAIKAEQAAMKRVLDVALSLILIVLTSPIMLVTAIIIKLTDHGPVLYCQTRCTLYQEPFRIMKFRSMRVDAEKDGVARLASKGDDRITPVGRFIRSCRIDELPQLFNIL
ncbi:MAG: sugar transferase, partial [Butyrivibrio sp.]|nr:sugar transferase [Butyrivibrio sp.]